MPKKSSTTTTQTTSRQSHNARRPVDEETDEDIHANCMDTADEVEDDEFDASQATEYQKLIIQGLSDQKKRHIFNKKKVKETYDTTKTDLQDGINKLFDEHEDQSNTVHHAQLARLAELLILKDSLESQMAVKLAELRARYDTHSQELCAAVDARIKDLK
ncbi:hypothetical protein EKO04_009399 [Ascochyta lentis]|uniref:Uncharacterized protein n=1 Tax=Ascochyta lentis TaxID=205686 RepID=A0A8H7IWZ1_9PLEO|nr:hypothetical protein EKO04_009399 [Ascochyta lentis]